MVYCILHTLLPSGINIHFVLYCPQDIFDNIIGTGAVHSKRKLNHSQLFSWLPGTNHFKWGCVFLARERRSFIRGFKIILNFPSVWRKNFNKLLPGTLESFPQHLIPFKPQMYPFKYNGIQNKINSILKLALVHHHYQNFYQFFIICNSPVTAWRCLITHLLFSIIGGMK